MGRQWLHAKREVASLKKSKTTSKFVREITLAARQGADPALNARLATALERAKRESVAKDVIQRAIEKGSGAGAGKDSLEHMVFEGYAPHKVPVIAEVYTDNHNRTAPEIRVLFKAGSLGSSGSTGSFLTKWALWRRIMLKRTLTGRRRRSRPGPMRWSH